MQPWRERGAGSRRRAMRQGPGRRRRHGVFALQDWTGNSVTVPRTGSSLGRGGADWSESPPPPSSPPPLEATAAERRERLGARGRRKEGVRALR